jgi:hypothetical protein
MNPEPNSSEKSPISLDMQFRLNAPRVASQIIDGEAVLIHFETGCYYSAGKLGAEILHLAEEKKPVRQIVTELAGRYAAEPESIERSVTDFIGQLCDEQLVVSEPGAGGFAADPPAAQKTGSSEAKLPFEVPVLQKFTDLEDLLLLDPIHDADEAGWPVAKPDTTDSQA